MITHRLLATITLSLSLMLTGAHASSAAADTSSDMARELTVRLNHERRNRAIPELTPESRLLAAARAKAEAIMATESFDHTLADGRTPWVFLEAAGYSYTLAGENLAVDFAAAEPIHQAWLTSRSHRENMLDPSFTQVGIAAVTGELDHRTTTVVVELFGTPEAPPTVHPTTFAPEKLFAWFNRE